MGNCLVGEGFGVIDSLSFLFTVSFERERLYEVRGEGGGGRGLKIVVVLMMWDSFVVVFHHWCN